jgi:anti-sigma regulatory factor (Ser/Thr protein kinase)
MDGWTRAADAKQRAQRGGPEMQITLSLTLPRDEQTIPVTRHIVHHALQEVGAREECMDDIAVAQTEACANVVKHSGPGDQYEVRVDIDEQKCVIRVIDTGRGFDWESLSDIASPDTSAERGRGILLMRTLVDEVRFVSRPEAGTIVHLEKALSFVDGAPMGGSRSGPGDGVAHPIS